MINLLRNNIGLTVWLGIFSVSAVVSVLSAYLMSTRGLSLKPIWWFNGYLLLIGLPQLAYHAYVAALSARAPAAAETSPVAVSRIDSPETFFTAPPEGATVVDIPPQSASGLFGRAEQGRMLTLRNGNTVMVFRFRSKPEAAGAVAAEGGEGGRRRRTFRH